MSQEECVGTGSAANAVQSAQALAFGAPAVRG
jgi:hypothetical protein